MDRYPNSALETNPAPFKPGQILRRDETEPQVLPLRAAVPNPEWEGDYPLWNWTPDAIQAAAIQHDLGNFVWSERLYEACTREGRIFSALQRRAEGVKAFAFGFEYKPGTPERLQALARALEEKWDEDVLSETDRSEVIARTGFFGFCVCRVHKPLIDGQRVTKLEVWTHRTLAYDMSVKGFRGLDDQATQVVIPREGNDEWIVFSLGGKKPWLKAMVRPLARVLYEINQTNDLWDSNNEALGYAQKILGVPNQIREQSEVQAAWDVARRLRSGDTWLKPEGYSLELLETKRGDTHMNFKARLDVLWATVAIIILYHNLTQETKSGSLAATKSAMDLPREAAVKDARVLEIGYRRALRIWVRMNFAPAHYAELPRALEYYAPHPCFDTEEPEDEKQLAETGDKNSSSLQKFLASAKAAGVKIESIGIDWRKQAQRCNIALLAATPDQKDGPPPVAYLPAPPNKSGAPAGAPRVAMMSAREPESEAERLAEGLPPVRPIWTV